MNSIGNQLSKFTHLNYIKNSFSLGGKSKSSAQQKLSIQSLMKNIHQGIYYYIPESRKVKDNKKMIKVEHKDLNGFVSQRLVRNPEYVHSISKDQPINFDP